MIAGGAGVAALAAMNATIRKNASEPDDSALGGEARFFAWKYGKIFYKTAGTERPGRPYFHPRYRRQPVELREKLTRWRAIRVYAVDLLGFGFSDKPGTVPTLPTSC